MNRNAYYIGIAFFGMINGMFNPLLAFSYVFSKALMFAPLFGSEGLITYFASLMLSSATVARRNGGAEYPGHRQLPQRRTLEVPPGARLIVAAPRSE